MTCGKLAENTLYEAVPSTEAGFLQTSVLNHFTTSPRVPGAAGGWLPLEDSNLGSRIQSPLSYH